jgi:hypothetical protein
VTQKGEDALQWRLIVSIDPQAPEPYAAIS